MWRLVVQQAGLAAHLAALRRYLLLGQGDVYQAFLTLARSPRLQPLQHLPAGAAAQVPAHTPCVVRPLGGIRGKSRHR